MSHKIKAITLIMILAFTMLVGCNGLRYSGTKGGKTKYQDVKTDVVELTIKYSSDMRPVNYVFNKSDDGFYFEEESVDNKKEPLAVSEEIHSKVNEWVDEYNIRSWDGYDMTQKHVTDGSSFRIDITLATGESISAHGSNAFPKGYSDANTKLREIIKETKEEIEENTPLLEGN